MDVPGALHSFSNLGAMLDTITRVLRHDDFHVAFAFNHSNHQKNELHKDMTLLEGMPHNLMWKLDC